MANNVEQLQLPSFEFVIKEFWHSLSLLENCAYI